MTSPSASRRRARIVEQTGLFGERDTARAREVLRWQFWDNHKGSSQFGTLRYLMNFLPEAQRGAEVIAFLAGRARAALALAGAGERTQSATGWWGGGGGRTDDGRLLRLRLSLPRALRLRWQTGRRSTRLGRIAALDGWRPLRSDARLARRPGVGNKTSKGSTMPVIDIAKAPVKTDRSIRNLRRRGGRALVDPGSAGRGLSQFGVNIAVVLLDGGKILAARHWHRHGRDRHGHRRRAR
ncbi:MAG: hypothetical protein R3D80_20910 [Paracoccaceae bacterium]